MEASLPASHKSPGPPDMASHGDTTDEDSQESMTLQNALPPLPETQRDSPEHDLSLPTERNGGVQLLSRPQNLDIDPGESFAWGPPVKIVPGKFGRSVPAKSTVDAIKENAAATSPFVIVNQSSKAPDAIATGSVQSTPSATRQFGLVISPNSRHLSAEDSSRAALPSIEGSLTSADYNQPHGNDDGHLTRVQTSARPPPFKDYQPQYQRLDGRDQASVTESSHARQIPNPEGLSIVEAQHHGVSQVKGRVPHRGKPLSEQGRGSHHQVDQCLQQDQPTDDFQANGPRHRISLPNDTSVSPAQLPQQLPRETPQHQALPERLAQKHALGKSPPLNLNRPVRDVRQVSKTKTPTHCPSSRSPMHGSNIGKRRSRIRPSASDRPRPSRHQDSRRHDDTPSIRRRDPRAAASYRSPSLEDIQQSHETPDIDVVAGNLAQALNSNFEMMRNEWRRKNQEISYLERNIRKQEQKLSNFQRQSEGKSGRIQELEEDRVRLQEQLESANQDLEDRSTKLSELQKKCRTYKEHLNSATAEQQDLYKAAKAKCETAIKQMREEEHKRKALDEQQRRELQATRERLTQIVKSTVDDYSSKEREFNNKLESLHERIQEREADVERERETIRGLLEQNATVESIQGTVKTFEAQIEQITTKLGELASSHVERDGAAAEETRAKLDKIVEHLCALDKRVEPQASIIEKIQDANMQTFAAILDPVLKSHTEIQTNLQKLSDAVEDYMEDFWMKLEDREDVLTELLEQTQADNAQLQADVQLREDECNVLLENLEQAGATTRQREKDLENLKNEIAELEQAQANDMEQAARAKSLHEDCEKLKVDVAGKAALAHNLEIRLQHSQAALLNEMEQHKRHTQELQRLMEQREQAARAAQEAAVEVARQEVTRDMGIAKENINTLLKQEQTDTAALKDELNAAKQQVSMVEKMNKRADTTVDELRSELETAQNKADRLGEEINEKDTEIQKAIDHRSAQVADLEAKLARKERKISELTEDAQTYDKQVQMALDGLKEWTKSHRAVKGFISELSKAQDGDLNGIDPKLKAILEIDMLHQAIFQYCRAQGRSDPKGDQDTAEESTTSKDVWADLPPSSPQEQMPPKNLATRVLDQVGRRVTIRSPSLSAPSPIPPSVSAEQEHRRSANPPKSIMKASSQSTIIEDEDLAEARGAAQSSSLPSRGFFGRRTYKTFALTKSARRGDGDQREQDFQDKGTFARTDFTRAPYNRPVSGTTPQAESAISGDGTHVGREPRKRKQADRPEMGSPKKRVNTEKETPRTSIHHHMSPPECQVSQGDEFQIPPSAPRKRARKNKNTLNESISPVRSLYFRQSVSTAEHKAARQRRNHSGAEDVNSVGPKASLALRADSNSHDGSQDSQLLEYPRRRSSRQNEDSQDSITHSQRMKSEPADPPYRARRFTMGQ